MDTRRTRDFAALMALGSAILYYLIGFEVLDVGDSTSGTTDLLGFGLIVGTTFLVFAILLARFERRWLWAAIALLDLVVIVGYLAMAGVRAEPFAPWGLLVKALQLALLGALGWLLVRSPGRTHRSERSAAP